ncbi:ThuA domain-containing protein [Pseudarthrobacter sp. MEB009]|uniref:ThuA domain-containing protein n=1 Tax=Pseudarthrobacter sp. MEB009 TaxID=3040326 RepID=UPI0025560376|nr:ThuA domain-containing protein [Pseudarthrobacter sp. MEB009]
MAGATPARPTALLLSGTGRYADPWHPFAETSAALADLLREAGFDAVLPPDVDAALAALADLPGADLPALLAINVGLPRDGAPSPGTPQAAAGLSRWLRLGRPLLASHSSATSFTDLPEWEDGLGGRWIRGTSMHPDYGPAAISVRPESGPVVAGIPDFVLPDEKYSYLRTAPGITVHATHVHNGLDHPTVWSLERPGAGSGGSGRTVYDALGHDAASYASPEHRRLLRQAIGWLTAGSPDGAQAPAPA